MDDVMAREARLPDAVLRYADHDDGLVDLFLPQGDGPHPFVVSLHGGFWRDEFDRHHGRPLAEQLADDGFAVALPEYRRVGGGGGWPVTAYDVREAVDALDRLLPELRVDTGPTSLVGHSAGGHLALWLAGEPCRLRLDAVVGLAPVADLREAARLGLGQDATQALLGGTPDQVASTYAEADPMSRLGTRWHPPVTILHGTADDVVPVDLSRGLVRAHEEVELVELDGVDHFDVIDPRSAAYAVLRDRLPR